MRERKRHHLLAATFLQIGSLMRNLEQILARVDSTVTHSNKGNEQGGVYINTKYYKHLSPQNCCLLGSGDVEIGYKLLQQKTSLLAERRIL